MLLNLFVGLFGVVVVVVGFVVVVGDVDLGLVLLLFFLKVLGLIMLLVFIGGVGCFFLVLFWRVFLGFENKLLLDLLLLILFLFWVYFVFRYCIILMILFFLNFNFFNIVVFMFGSMFLFMEFFLNVW